MQKSLKDIFKGVPNIDERSAQFLIQALEKNNIDGFDYIEYKQSLGALSELDIDEAMSFKSAYATATTMGLTKEKLIKTAQFYLQVLHKEKSQFNDAVQSQVQRQVAGKAQQSENFHKTIEHKKAQMDKLKAEILEHQEAIVRLNDEIVSAKDKIEVTKQNFEQTYAIIEQEIKDDLDKIQIYIK
jgi:chromosome segregation ATPase